MALSDVNSSEYYWYYSAYGSTKLDESLTPTDFGAGEKNTQTMIAMWNSSAYGSQNAGRNKTDMWGLSAVQSGTWNGSSGWYVPSKEEWAAFGDALGIDKWNYENYGLSSSYWTSCKGFNEGFYNIAFYYGSIPSSAVNHVTMYVRLGTTF